MFVQRHTVVSCVPTESACLRTQSVTGFETVAMVAMNTDVLV